VARAFGLVVRFTLAPGAGERFDSLVAETVGQIRMSEPGTLFYACHRVEGEPSQRIFYELYRDRAAFEEHEAQDHVKRFLRDREQYLTRTDVDYLDLQAAKGVPAGAPEGP
jgi:quinol monooxygenase YgiN